jgi:hypothetical protein
MSAHLLEARPDRKSDGKSASLPTIQSTPFLKSETKRRTTARYLSSAK